jgi:hypothetical protein
MVISRKKIKSDDEAKKKRLTQKAILVAVSDFKTPVVIAPPENSLSPNGHTGWLLISNTALAT